MAPRESGPLRQGKSRSRGPFPDLQLGLEGDIVFVHGSFAVMFEGHVSDRYSIELQLPGIIPSRFLSSARSAGASLTIMIAT